MHQRLLMKHFVTCQIFSLWIYRTAINQQLRVKHFVICRICGPCMSRVHYFDTREWYLPTLLSGELNTGHYR